MRYLIDTHALLWIIDDDPRLSQRAKDIYLCEDHAILLSMASVWELAIKLRLGKLIIQGDLQQFVQEHVIGNNIEVLPIELAHLYYLQALGHVHNDPFDRLLVSQALSENLPLISSDSWLDGYPIQRIW